MPVYPAAIAVAGITKADRKRQFDALGMIQPNERRTQDIGHGVVGALVRVDALYRWSSV